MANEDILKKIEEIYVTKNKEGKPTGKNFITHLLRAYFPIGKAQKVLDTPKGKVMKCAITGQKLMAADEIFYALHNADGQFMKDMVKHMQFQINPENKSEIEHPLAKITNGRLLGLTGEKTDTYLCHEALQELFNWYATKILMGDKHVNWVIKDMQRQAVIQQVREKLPDAEDQKKIDRVEQLSKKPKRATMSLGDLHVLTELHEKLKQQEGK
jgi:hypothetical protein